MRGGFGRPRCWSCGRDAPPLDLRIDLSETPLRDLRDLLNAVRTSPYADWLDEVPTERAPTRAPGPPRAAE
jgi:hypothetical protein